MRIGLLATDLGAGRQRVDDIIDPKAGIVLKKKLGDKVDRGETVAVIHTDREEVVDRAALELSACIDVGPAVVPRKSSIHAIVDAEGIRPWVATTQY